MSTRERRNSAAGEQIGDFQDGGLISVLVVLVLLAAAVCIGAAIIGLCQGPHTL